MSSAQDGLSEGHPAFPTPSLGGRFINASGASRREGVVVIASAAKQSILFARQDGLLVRQARAGVILPVKVRSG